MAETKWEFGKAKVFAELKVAKVHFAVGGHARCDKNTQVVVGKQLTIADVSCAKCKKYADYRAAMANQDDAKKDAKSEAKPKAKAAPRTGTGPANQESTANQDQPAANQDQPADGANGKLSEENYKEKLKAAQTPKKPEKTAKPFVSGVGPNKKIYIKHVPTGQTMFNDVNEKALSTCLKYLNNVKIKWDDSAEKCPKGFIAAIKGAFEAAYKSHGLETKVKGTPPKETPEEAAEKAAQEALALLTPTAGIGSVVTLPSGTYKLTNEGWISWNEEGNIPKTEAKDIPKTDAKGKRKIKRRKKKDTPKTEAKKPAKRTIKRRKSKAKDKPKTEGKGKRQIKRRSFGRQLDKYGFTSGDIRSYIVGMMEKGAMVKTICKRAAKKFTMDEKTVQSKIQMIVRLLRKRKIPVTIVCFETKEKDYYQLTEPRK